MSRPPGLCQSPHGSGRLGHYRRVRRHGGLARRRPAHGRATAGEARRRRRYGHQYNGTGVDAALLEAAPRLRVISQLAAGLDNVDLSECTKRGIPVGSTPGILSKAVADHGFAMLLSAARRVVESDKWVRENNWKLQFHPTYWLGAEVQGSTLGIIGLGQIGLEMARRAGRVRHESVVLLPQPQAGVGVPSRADLHRLEHAAGRSRLRLVACAADARIRGTSSTKTPCGR